MQEKIESLLDEKRRMEEDMSLRAKNIEVDADAELDDVRQRFEAKMAAEKKTTLLLKGENGIMRKKYAQLSKTIADQKDEIKVLKDKERELRESIRGLDKDILVRGGDVVLRMGRRSLCAGVSCCFCHAICYRSCVRSFVPGL